MKWSLRHWPALQEATPAPSAIGNSWAAFLSAGTPVLVAVVGYIAWQVRSSCKAEHELASLTMELRGNNEQIQAVQSSQTKLGFGLAAFAALLASPTLLKLAKILGLVQAP